MYSTKEVKELNSHYNISELYNRGYAQHYSMLVWAQFSESLLCLLLEQWI